MKGNLYLVPLRHKHHAKHSGYDRFIHHLDAIIIDPVQKWTITRRAIGRIFRPRLGENSGSIWYHRESFVREIEIAPYWIRDKNSVFHFLYGENSFRYFGNLKRLGNRNSIVCTYHCPPDKFQKTVTNTEHMKQIDAVILLSTMAMDYFANIVGDDKVFYIPRGVDNHYFCPPENDNRGQSSKFKCLFVGTHLRDFSTLSKAIAIVNSQNKDIEFNIVTFKRYHDHFYGLSNCNLMKNISDEQLLLLYQSCHALVLPLIDATANNVILEAMGCAQPVISTNLQGVRDYVSDDCAILTDAGNEHELAAAILRLKNDSDLTQKMSEAAVKKAEEFSLIKTANNLLKLYKKFI
jgi:glycosyltransferase involved in cell wall biosynthesis